MGHDDKGKGAKETLVEDGRALVGKVYDDAAKPAVGQLGKTLAISISETGAADSDECDALLAAIEAEFPGRGALCTAGSIVLTPLSRQFLDTCVRVRRR